MTIAYTVRYNSRVRSVRLVVHRDGRVVVTVRSRWYAPLAERFVHSKADWIKKKLAHFSLLPKPISLIRSRKEVARLRQMARELAEARLEHFNRLYSFKYNRITIRDQKTRWGSCSKKGTLSFNYRIALLAPELADYVIVHELCHLGAFNHSKQFWALVAQALPDHIVRRRAIKKHSLR